MKLSDIIQYKHDKAMKAKMHAFFDSGHYQEWDIIFITDATAYFNLTEEEVRKYLDWHNEYSYCDLMQGSK